MKFASDRPYSDPEKAARKIVEIANSVEAGQEGRIYIELINGPFLYRERGTEEYKAALDLAIERGWLVLHESSTFVRFTQAGSDLFAWTPTQRRRCPTRAGGYVFFWVTPQVANQ